MKNTLLLYGALVFAGGLVGGALTSVVCRSRPVAAAPGSAKSDNTAASTTGRVVIASEFLLTDPEGRQRAKIDIDREGQAGFALFDREQRPRAQIVIDSLGAPSVRLYDTSNKLRLSLEVSTDGIPTVRLMDTSDRARALLGVDAEGEAGLNFYAQDGRLLRELP